LLENEIKWEQKKIEDLIKKKETYADPSILEKLQEKKKEQIRLNEKIEEKLKKYKNSEVELDELNKYVNKLKKEHKKIIG
jgi:hypothetical protein